MSRLISKVLAVMLVTAPLAACGTDTIATSPVDPDTLVARIADGSAPVILDVRTPEEYAAGHVPGAINVSHDAIAEQLDQLPFAKDAEVAVYCGSGRRAGLAEKVLIDAGYTQVRDLSGHWKDWIADGRTIDTD